MLGFLALAGVVELVPSLGRFRVLTAPPKARTETAALPTAAPVGETKLEGTESDHADLAQPESLDSAPKIAGVVAKVDEPELEGHGVTRSPVAIVDEGRSLDRFFAALAASERRDAGAVTRVTYFGDSVVASDFGTGTLRRLLQRRFGDSGHGFVLVASAWPQYFHNDVSRQADKGWNVSRVVGPRAKDRLYGLGGVSFTGQSGLRSRIGTAKTGTFGQRVSRFEIATLGQPTGGVVDVKVDGVTALTLDTSAPEKHAVFTELRVPDGPHELELLMTRGASRLFGVALERDTPGVVLDAIGLVGARIRTLDEIEPAHFAEALAWRKPNLVAFQFGANESGDGFAYPMPEYHRSMRALLERVKTAVPGASCLIVGAMDREREGDDGHLVTVPVIPLIVEEQRKVAAEVGCAYYSLYDAMGGRGSMASWVKKGFGAGDFTHPTSWGAEQIGKWIYAALMDRYADHSRSR